MTQQRSFKRLVRTRMEKTGESYTAARAMLLAAAEPTPWLATSDDAIRERTGRGWEEWFDVLDSWGALGMKHRDIARRVAAELEIDPLAWNAQAITASYERTRGLRVAGEREDGFSISVSKTVAVPIERLYDAFFATADDRLRERTVTRPKSARFDWGDDGSRVHVTFDASGEQKSRIVVEHARLADADEAERMKAFWRERLTELKGALRCLSCSSGRSPRSWPAAPTTPSSPPRAATCRRGSSPLEVLRCLVLVAVVAWLASEAGIDDLAGGLALGAALFAGFPLVLWTGAIIHENTPVRLAVLHGGDWLIKLLLVGAVVSMV